MDRSESDFVNHLGGSDGTIQQALDELKQKKSSVDQVRDKIRYQAPTFPLKLRESLEFEDTPLRRGIRFSICRE